MKKLLLLTLFLLAPIYAFANVDDNVWSYLFHLQVKGGVLSVAEGVKFSYDSVPMQFTPVIDVGSAEFYGSIVNVKGKVDATFGVPSATLVNQATGASPIDVDAPYFADADHVAFYNKSGKHLFDVSVKKSSFCNDDGKCNAAVGENYQNCPADCAAPIDAIAPEQPLPSITPAQPATSATPTPTPLIAETHPSASTSYVTKDATPQETNTASRIDTKTILSFVGGILLIILAVVFYRVRKSAE